MKNDQNNENNKTVAEEKLLKALQEGEKSAEENGWIDEKDVRKLLEE